MEGLLIGIEASALEIGENRCRSILVHWKLCFQANEVFRTLWANNLISIESAGSRVPSWAPQRLGTSPGSALY